MMPNRLPLLPAVAPLLSVLMAAGACGSATSAPAAAPNASTPSPRAPSPSPDLDDLDLTEVAKTMTIECDGRKQTFDRSCTAKVDCAIARLNMCCGEISVIGVRASERERFAAAACPCSPGLGCSLGPLKADDGKTPRETSGTDVDVECVAGACATHVR